MAQQPSSSASTHSIGSTQISAAAKVLAPTGRLRVGVYQGSPTSYIPASQQTDVIGVGYHLGRALAQSLNVPFEPVIFAKNADVLKAAKAGELDFVFTNATQERKAFLLFSQPVMQVEKSVLLAPGSNITSLDALAQKSWRIGVSAGSSTGQELIALYPLAQLLPQTSLKAAAQQLLAGQLDGFATNKSILFELSDTLPGSKVLEGAWGLETFAIGVPMGREAAESDLNSFVSSMRSQGQLQQLIQNARLRGIAPQK